MVLCRNCQRYFRVGHDGKLWHLCDMDCFVESIGYTDVDSDIECDFYEPMDSDYSEIRSNEA